MQTNNLSFGLEIKSVSGRRFEGYGSIFGNLDRGGDIMVPGAFGASLKKHAKAGTMPLMFWMHQADQVPGVWTKMEEDRDGLRVEGELVDTALGRDVRTLLEKKAVRGLSIGYAADDIDYDRDGNRLLKTVDLREVSIVSMAMNPLATVVGMKARLSGMGEYVPTERELERIFRDAGCSKAVSRSLVSRIVEDTDTGGMPVPRWDAGAVEDEVNDEAKAMLEMLGRLTDQVGAASIHRY